MERRTQRSPTSLGGRCIAHEIDIGINAPIIDLEQQIRSIIYRGEGGEEGSRDVEIRIDCVCALHRATGTREKPRGASVAPSENDMVDWC